MDEIENHVKAVHEIYEREEIDTSYLIHFPPFKEATPPPWSGGTHDARGPR